MGYNIEVPVIEITDGWCVDELKTIEDCEDAFLVLTAVITSIEAKLDHLEMTRQDNTDDYIKTKAALRWKKAAVVVTQKKSGRFNRQAKEDRENRQERKLISFFKAKYPDAYDSAIAHFEALLI